jgi:thioredoxin-related protein
MKIFLFVFTILLGTTQTEWSTDFDQAKQEAKRSSKLIMLNFSGSDWCAPCILMKKDVFDKPAFQEYALHNLVLVRADFPRQKKNKLDPKQQSHNEELADQYNSEGKFPLTLLLDADGQVIYEWDGYQRTSAEEFVEQLKTKVDGR